MGNTIGGVLGDRLHGKVHDILRGNGGAQEGGKDDHIVGEFLEPGERVGDGVAKSSLKEGEECKAKEGDGENRLLETPQFFNNPVHLLSNRKSSLKRADFVLSILYGTVVIPKKSVYSKKSMALLSMIKKGGLAGPLFLYFFFV